jgi:hypothetical protein
MRLMPLGRLLWTCLLLRADSFPTARAPRLVTGTILAHCQDAG